MPNDDGPGQATNMEMFDLDNPNAGWTIVSQMSYRRSQVHLVVNGELMYAIGGMENGGYTSTVEVTSIDFSLKSSSNFLGLRPNYSNLERS